MLTKQYVLDNLSPCGDGAEWLATQPDLATAWRNCQRSDWMLWLLDEANMLTKKQDLAIQVMVLETPIGDGRTVLDLITDERSLAFIDLKRRRLAGDEVNDAASSAAWNAAWNAARDAARDAARSAARDAARDAASSAARSAASSAARSAAWNAARDAAWNAAWEWQADKVREIIDNPFKK